MYTDKDFQEFFDSYVETALWSSTDESRDDGGDPLDDNYGPEDIAPKTLEEMKKDCRDFLDENWELIDLAYSSAGHDFWLTRNRHGAGFWDGDWKYGDELTKSAHAYGSVDLVVGQDGLIYS